MSFTMEEMMAQMRSQPLGPLRRKMWDTQFVRMEELVTQNLIHQVARQTSVMGWLPYAMPMFYQVWFEYILGRICIIAGDYKTCLKQLEYAKSVWEGHKGWKSGDSSVEGVKNKESHNRMIAENLERCQKGELT